MNLLLRVLSVILNVIAIVINAVANLLVPRRKPTYSAIKNPILKKPVTVLRDELIKKKVPCSPMDTYLFTSKKTNKNKTRP